MKTLFFEIIYKTWHLFSLMAPWLLIGLISAGLIGRFFSKKWIKKHLAANSWKGIVKAVFLGIPLPLCSCGVIPVAAELKRAGASKGAVAAFTASTPQTGFDSIAATYSLMGLPFTVARICADVLSGLLSGFSIQLFDSGKDSKLIAELEESSCSGSCNGEVSDKSEVSLSQAKTSLGIRFWQSIKHSFVDALYTLPKEIGIPILVGSLIGSLLAILLEDLKISDYLNHSFFMYLFASMTAIPMYVCSTGSIPIAYGLIAAGITPGAAIVFLVAGPATNTVTVTSLMKLIGKKETAIYLSSLIGSSWAVGFIFDFFGWFPSGSLVCMDSSIGVYENICGVFLLLVLTHAIFGNKIKFNRS
jgi:uncharacterized membrane protein YraQ (UPF0718 family)